ncbi:MAG: hypothetical protein LBG62_04580 [Candidatus Methanoplasma sp.]|jgi:hypothetical protein|nr:hypothetical protein [Candidatus Methanoplasma sp.]
MRRRYERAFGSAYACESPDAPRLDAVLRGECERLGIMWRREDAFAYLRELEPKWRQSTPV